MGKQVVVASHGPVGRVTARSEGLGPLSQRREWLALTALLLVAAALRFSLLGEVPPGLSHDEVANWLVARGILAGEHAIYFTAAYGHEPVYHYLQAGFVALLGDNWLGLRFPSAAVGMLGVAASYALVRRLFGTPIALLASAMQAVGFWPLFYARVGLRAITLPVTAALFAYYLVRGAGIRRSGAVPDAGGPTGNWLAAGLLLGLSLYTYMAARALPVIAVVFLAYLLLVRRPAPRLWRQVMLMFAVAAVVAAPLAVWLLRHPGAEYRISEVSEPLEKLLAGDMSLALQNLSANLKMFTVTGDPWPRQNLPGRPVFDEPISAMLFYAGLVIALWRWRDPRYGFIVIWLMGALVPSIVTSVAPSFIRDILAVVVVYIFPSLAMVQGHLWLRSRRPRNAANRRLLLIASWALIVLPVSLVGVLTVRDYFVHWPEGDVVRFDYQAHLTDVARRVDRLPTGAPVSVAGLSVHTMDGPTLTLAARRGSQDVRLCDTRETLVVPTGRNAWLFVPKIVPLDADLRDRALAWGSEIEDRASFTGYRFRDGAAAAWSSTHLDGTAVLPGGRMVELPASFGGQLALLGYERLLQPSSHGDALLTYWRVERRPPTPLKVFAHWVDESGALAAQHDGLASPPDSWSVGDLIVQKHVVPDCLPAGRYRVHVGIYDVMTGTRLPVLAADHLLLYSTTAAECGRDS